jgi:hypothetical protein
MYYINIRDSKSDAWRLCKSCGRYYVPQVHFSLCRIQSRRGQGEDYVDVIWIFISLDVTIFMFAVSTGKNQYIGIFSKPSAKKKRFRYIMQYAMPKVITTCYFIIIISCYVPRKMESVWSSCFWSMYNIAWEEL